MELFVVDGIDFTEHIKVPSYKVNRTPVYEEWEDGNYLKHREITRTRVSGSFTVLFDDVLDFDQFVLTIESLIENSDTGAIPMTVYINNKVITAEINAFIKYTPANEKPIYGIEKVSGFEVSIEEQ